MKLFEDYRITSPYGYRNDPFTGQRVMHGGIDLVKPHQSPIYAFEAGQVVYSSEGKTGTGFGNYGITVAIKDKKGALHCYCHLDMVVVSVGESVGRGKMIGRQGNTGKSTGSHLHYEIRLKDAPSYGHGSHTDPTEYLTQLYEEEKKEMESKKFEVSSWAQAAHTWAVEQGITDGTRPKDGVSREELWTMLYRFSKLKGE